ncbi:hypothetical protein SeMB42_g02152 [Synchytrium endobioticum]|uniref:BTB domain-containing protein n=1 Tax=Synchytrium endobioticum TaxID=286115 RepID=A0A507BXN5_9FUNG|nr:hypothetical protein SeLEV6574_g08502 [Synchytrium endobioticum]TPX40973.1 hypothetical protein SeLEV6574_g06312 [Synchytrium endobioticum]TPX50733.1 hypothetical protein SeMB42_g02152 [Synchytrium endobioticum]
MLIYSEYTTSEVIETDDNEVVLTFGSVCVAPDVKIHYIGENSEPYNPSICTILEPVSKALLTYVLKQDQYTLKYVLETTLSLSTSTLKPLKNVNTVTVALEGIRSNITMSRNDSLDWYATMTLSSNDLRNMGPSYHHQTRFGFTFTIQPEKPKDSSMYMPKPSLAPKPFANYLYDPHLSDAIIEVIRPGGSSINIFISKLVVADSSPVFLKMFQAGMSETQSSRITISDVSEASVRAMVEFAYTNQVSTKLESSEHRRELFDLSEQYEMPDLSALAGSMIAEKDLNKDTVVSLLDFSEKYSDQTLYQACYCYLKDYYDDILETLLIDGMKNGGDGVRKAIIKLLKVIM